MYAVAGVSGQTGAAVAEALLAAGEKVRVIVRRPDAGDAWRKRGADVAVAELANAAALAAALRGAAGAYLLNPPAYATPDPFAVAAAVGAAFAAAIDESGVGRVVVLSSVGAQIAQGTGVIGSNHRIEQALARVAAPVASLRARYFFENWRHVLGAVKASGVLPSFLAPTDRRIGMVAVADIAAAVTSLLRGAAWQRRRVVELSSFDASPDEVARALASVLDKPVKAVAVPREQWAGILAGNGMSPAAVAAFVEMYDGINSGLVAPEPGAQLLAGRMDLASVARKLVGDAA
ncbi:MAG TPA: NmrA family NAD(P)-binding protein [Casimicrobiaceae bacterium]|nr:NmrA family NAD(P)-binding protein [Casimicrobiaceae bacterium]